MSIAVKAKDAQAVLNIEEENACAKRSDKFDSAEISRKTKNAIR
jgi:hypothetical protein